MLGVIEAAGKRAALVRAQRGSVHRCFRPDLRFRRCSTTERESRQFTNAETMSAPRKSIGGEMDWCRYGVSAGQQKKRRLLTLPPERGRSRPQHVARNGARSVPDGSNVAQPGVGGRVPSNWSVRRCCGRGASARRTTSCVAFLSLSTSSAAAYRAFAAPKWLRPRRRDGPRSDGGGFKMRPGRNLHRKTPSLHYF